MIVSPPEAARRSSRDSRAAEQIRLFWGTGAAAGLPGEQGWALVPKAAVAEVLFLSDAVGEDELATHLAGDPLKPVVFLGARRTPAEFAVDDARPESLAAALAEARAAAVKLRVLRTGPGADYVADLFRLTLAFAFTRGGCIASRIGPSRIGGLGWACDFSLEMSSRAPVNPMPLLASLLGSGYLSEHLAEVAHACPACHGIQVLMRDCCLACGSPDLEASPIVHHFRCAYQAPESEFLAEGRSLICPKCRRELRHFGLDYDKPGEVMVCGACGHRGTETEVRGRCLDCEATFPADAAPRIRICDYRLTDAGLHAVMSGQARVFDPLRLLGETLTLVPLETLFLSVRQFAALEARGGVKSLVLTLGLEQAMAASAGSGEEISLVLSIGGELVKHLRDTDIAAYDRGTLYIVLPGAPPQASEAIARRVFAALRATFEATIIDRLRFASSGAAAFLETAQSAA